MVITKLTITDPNVLIDPRYIRMVLAKELEKNFQGFLPIFKCFFVITELTITHPNFFIALGNIRVLLAKDLKPNC
jgi:hypothetical protein